MIGDLFLTSASDAPKLRIGLLVDDLKLQAVFAAVIDQIQASSFAEIVLVVRNGEATEAPAKVSILKRALKFLKRTDLRHVIAYALYMKLDARRPHDARLDPIAPVDCAARLASVDQMVVNPTRKGYVHRLVDADIALIKTHDIDVLMRFGFNILKGDILTVARYGIWSFHHGDNDLYRGSPPGLWEMMEGTPQSGVILQILSEELDNGVVLARGQFATVDNLSLFDNRLGPYWGSVHFVVWKLKQLYEQGYDALVASGVPPAPYRGQRRLYTKPHNREVLRWLLPAVGHKIREKLHRRVEHWQTALRLRQDDHCVLPAAGSADLSDFKFLKAPKGHFYADPFLFEQDGRTYLFVEDYSYATKRGVIAVMDITDGVPDAAETCLETQTHLSYPFVFAHAGETYMIPESMDAGHVALYRAEAFPRRWVLERVLFTAPVVDTTLWIEDGVFYFFATLMEPGTTAMSLNLFTADSLTGKWQMHPANPISSDVRDARAAGHLFRQDGVLYRVAQDCSGTYGRALRFFRVDALTPVSYAETFVLEVGPDAVSPFDGCAATGIHTYNRAGGFEVIDAKFKLPAKMI